MNKTSLETEFADTIRALLELMRTETQEGHIDAVLTVAQAVQHLADAAAGVHIAATNATDEK